VVSAVVSAITINSSGSYVRAAASCVPLPHGRDARLNKEINGGSLTAAAFTG
jgi:hypothetical protein